MFYIPSFLILFICQYNLFFLLFEVFWFPPSTETERQFKRKTNVDLVGTKDLFPWYLILTNFTQEEAPLVTNTCPDLFGLQY